MSRALSLALTLVGKVCTGYWPRLVSVSAVTANRHTPNCNHPQAIEDKILGFQTKANLYHRQQLSRLDIKLMIR